MDTDRNLLFGVLALQAGLIDTAQFVEACTLWASRKESTLADLLIERGWIVLADQDHLDYLLRRKLQKGGVNTLASLAAVPDEVKRSLAAIGDESIQQSLAGLSPAAACSQETMADPLGSQPERHTLIRLPATGGIGRVWLARDHVLGRDVPLKELRPEQSHHASLATRFRIANDDSWRLSRRFTAASAPRPRTPTESAPLRDGSHGCLNCVGWPLVPPTLNRQ